MKFSASAVALVAAAGFANAAPLVVERQAPAITDADILNYALTLEHLENTFYRTGLQNFTQQQFADAGFDEKFYNNLKTIAFDEQVHVDFLTAGLQEAGATPVKECTYAFPVDSVKAFVLVSSVLEGVGVSAYLGAAADIMSKEYLTAAGSILAIEARHTSYIRSSLDISPFPQPFDVPLSINQVFTLAAQFIKECPADNPALPVKAFPTLTLDPTTAMPIKAGSTVKVLTPGYLLKPADGTSPIYGAFITLTGPIFVDTKAVDGGFELTIPEGVNGQSYVVLTGCKDKVSDDTVAAGPAIIEITN
ncbi:MAG: hypothetical protein M1817_001186 [Caeruleum heppii]|nr:MAG: hypothetical protein M1817_001186 [Caeruleum heppii]